jgi:hypothetical protein
VPRLAPLLIAPLLLASASSRPSLAAPADRPRAFAAPVTVAPVLDGEVMGDPAWSLAPVATGFTQQNPSEGQPASEKTEVRVLYDRERLYIGVICHDSRPGDIVRAEGRRDSPLDQVDSFQILLDTFLDRQNAFVFGTTPAGAEFDGQVINDGGGDTELGSPQQGGSLAGFNLNWDAVWQVRTRTGPFGWSAELAIPFRTLRYAAGGRQSWGINFQRVIQRRNETAFWAPLGRQQDLYRVSWAGTLEGLDLPPQRNLKLIPYVLGEASRSYLAGPAAVPGGPPAPPGDWDFGANAGGDLKYSLTPSLTLDATVRTDFAQVEVDEQQLQLDRFNLFFPEKRPFFLENAGFFSAGVPGAIDLFFSRRIGIGASGEIIPIVGGARVSGKVGPARLGVLNMQTEAVSGVAPASNFTVARFGWELGNRSSLGLFFGNRQSTGDDLVLDAAAALPPDPGPGEYGRTYAADGRLGVGQYGLVSGFFAATDTPGDQPRPIAWNLSTQYDSPAWLLELKAGQVGEGFDPQVGFLERENYRFGEAMILYRYRPAAFLAIKQLSPHVYASAHVKPGGFLESRFVHVDNYTEWPSGLWLSTAVNFTHEGVLERFEIDPKQQIFVEPGRYQHAEGHLGVETPAAWPVIAEGELTAGGFFGGRKLSGSLGLLVRAGEVLSAELQWDHNRVDLPAGDFVVNLGHLRLSYSLSPRAFVQALVQYNDRFDIWSTNLRLGWLRDANTGLFVVYNENRGLGQGVLDPELGPAPRGMHLRDRRVVLKLSWLFDVLH